MNNKKSESSMKGTLIFTALLMVFIIGIAVFSTSSKSSWTKNVVLTDKKILTRGHTVKPMVYKTKGNPPTGGDHFPGWQNCGYFPAGVYTEAAVHSLEHGAVWLTWNKPLSEKEAQFVQTLAISNKYLLASQYPTQDSPVILTAWGVQLKLKSLSEPGVLEFIAKYENGPQTPEPGAACTNGIDSKPGVTPVITNDTHVMNK